MNTKIETFLILLLLLIQNEEQKITADIHLINLLEVFIARY